MSVACQAHGYKWKRKEFFALLAGPTQDLTPESTFFSQADSFGGSSETSSVSAVFLASQEAANELPKVEMVRIPEVFLLFWTDTEVA